MSKLTPKYDEDFKKSIVSLHQNGKSQSDLSREYGVAISTIGKWIKIYSYEKQNTYFCLQHQACQKPHIHNRHHMITDRP